jgi:hypothetical protein
VEVCVAMVILSMLSINIDIWNYRIANSGYINISRHSMHIDMCRSNIDRYINIKTDLYRYTVYGYIDIIDRDI